MGKPGRLVGGYSRQLNTTVWEVLQQGKYRELWEHPERHQGILPGGGDPEVKPKNDWELVRHMG